MANDGFLRSIPSDADSDDGRLYDPTAADSGGGADQAEGDALGISSAAAGAWERIAGATTALASSTAGARERIAAASVGIAAATAGARERIAGSAVGAASASASESEKSSGATVGAASATGGLREILAGAAVGASETAGSDHEEIGGIAVGAASASGTTRELIGGVAVGVAGGTGIWSFVHIARGGWIKDEDIALIQGLFEREGKVTALAKPGVSAGRGSVSQPSQPAREMPNIVNVAWARSGELTASGAVPTASGSGSVLVSDEDMELVGALAGIDDEEWWT